MWSKVFQAKYIPYYIILGLVIVLVVTLNSGGERNPVDVKIDRSKAIIEEQKRAIKFWKSQTEKWQKKANEIQDKIETNETNIKIVYEKYDEERITVLNLSPDGAISYFATWLSKEDSIQQ